RGLVKRPGFTVLALIMFTFGIGSNTVMFSVINPLLLRQLPYKDSDLLVVAVRKRLVTGGDLYGVSPVSFAKWQDENSSFDDLAALRGVGGSALLGGAGLTPQLVRVGAISSNFFAMLGVQPLLGRPFTLAEEHQPGHAFGGAVCILSYT